MSGDDRTACGSLQSEMLMEQESCHENSLWQQAEDVWTAQRVLVGRKRNAEYFIHPITEKWSEKKFVSYLVL